MTMKKLPLRVLALVFAFLLLAACGKSGGKAEPVPPDTLWGKHTEFELVPIPEKAAAGESCRPVGLAPDGKQLLYVSFERGPYLYNLETGAIVRVTPGDKATETSLRESLMLRQLLGKREEEIEAYLEAHPELETLSGTQLMDRDAVSSKGASRVVYGASAVYGNYLILTNYNSGLCGAVNCDTGKFYQAPDRMDCVGVLDDCLVCTNNVPAKVVLYDTRTGGIRERFAGMSDSDYFWLQGAVPLQDGSLCGVFAGQTDMEKGQPIVLAVSDPEDRVVTYDLGRGYNSARYSIFGAGEHSILVCTANRSYPFVYLVRRDTGEVSLIWSGSKGAAAEIQSAPLADCLNADGMADVSSRVSGSPYLQVFGRLSDGKTALLYASEADCPILLFRPDTMEVSPLLESAASIPLVWALTGNGYDLWYDFIADREHYIRLTVG